MNACGKRRRGVDPPVVLDELIEEPNPNASIEQLREIGGVTRAALHRVGADTRRGEQIEELADDLGQLSAHERGLDRRTECALERGDVHVVVERLREARKQLDAVGSRNRERTPLADVGERPLRAHSRSSASFPSHVVVERADGNARGPGDIDHLRRREPALGEHLGRGIDDGEQAFGILVGGTTVTIMNHSF